MRNRNRNALHQLHAGGGQNERLLSHFDYTPAEALRLLVACLLQGLFTYARAHEPDRLQSLLSEVDAILDGCLLEEPYQKILDGLQEALDAHRPLDEQLIRDLALYAGMEGQLLQLAEEQAAPSNALYYAEKLRQARLYHKHGSITRFVPKRTSCIIAPNRLMRCCPNWMGCSDNLQATGNQGTPCGLPSTYLN